MSVIAAGLMDAAGLLMAQVACLAGKYRNWDLQDKGNWDLQDKVTRSFYNRVWIIAEWLQIWHAIDRLYI
jgi:hypothetical protein